jgi:hypothetical protein
MRRLDPQQLCPSEALPLGMRKKWSGLRVRFVYAHDTIFLHASIVPPGRFIPSFAAQIAVALDPVPH